MQSATVEEVQARLPEFLRQLSAGEEVVILSQGKPVGRLVPPSATEGVPVLGRGKGKLVIHADDDEHLKEGLACPSLTRRVGAAGSRTLI